MTFENADITTEACAWVAQIQTGDMSGPDIAAFREWVNRSPKHAAEISEIARLSGQLSDLVDMMDPLGAALVNARSNKIKHHPFPLWKKLTAGGAMCLIIGFFWISNLQFGPQLSEPQLYSTEIGRAETIHLADGSIIELNAASVLEVHYSEHIRKIRILGGEAFFKVTPDKTRPFIVYAGGKLVRAVGTAFSVNLSGGRFEVAVSEGVIEVANAAPAPTATPKATAANQPFEAISNPTAFIRMKANQVMATTDAPTAKAQAPVDLSPRDLQRLLSWREGLFDFSNTPLPEVVAELARYTTKKIEIADPALTERSFGGLFRTNEVDILIEALSDVGIRVEHVSEQHIRLYAVTS